MSLLVISREWQKVVKLMIGESEEFHPLAAELTGCNLKCVDPMV
jgi:hypothetical protein